MCVCVCVCARARTSICICVFAHCDKCLFASSSFVCVVVRVLCGVCILFVFTFVLIGIANLQVIGRLPKQALPKRRSDEVKYLDEASITRLTTIISCNHANTRMSTRACQFVEHELCMCVV